jgi:hypothetical protein
MSILYRHKYHANFKALKLKKYEPDVLTKIDYLKQKTSARQFFAIRFGTGSHALLPPTILDRISKVASFSQCATLNLSH